MFKTKSISSVFHDRRIHNFLNAMNCSAILKELLPKVKVTRYGITEIDSSKHFNLKILLCSDSSV